VLNAAARLIYHMRSADHITDALISLHWLRASQRIDKLPCWRSKYYMGALRDTWVHWFQSPIYKAGGHCVLLAPIALWCLPSGCLPSVAGLSRLLLLASGTPCQRRRRQLSRWRHSVDTSSHGSSDNRIQISSSDLCTRLSNCVM